MSLATGNHLPGRPTIFGTPATATLNTRSTPPTLFRPHLFGLPSTSSSKARRSDDEDKEEMPLPECTFKSGLEEDPAKFCPYQLTIQDACTAGYTQADYDKMTIEEAGEVGKKCMAETCKEIKSGKFLKEMLSCYKNGCEEGGDEKQWKVVKDMVAYMEKECGAAPAEEEADGKVADDKEEDGETKTTEGGESKDAAEKGEAVEDDEDEESAGVALGAGGWKRGVLVGALVFGSLFSGLMV